MFDHSITVECGLKCGRVGVCGGGGGVWVWGCAGRWEGVWAGGLGVGVDGWVGGVEIEMHFSQISCGAGPDRTFMVACTNWSTNSTQLTL